jgi:branched-chain amino acid transport system ATP-binding protein
MLLRVDDLNAGYGEVQVLRKMTITVDDGDRVGLFGPNGHGKTTLLRSVSGLVSPSQGDIVFAGASIRKASPREIVDMGLVHVPQGSTLFPRMTVLENLMLGAYPRRAWVSRKRSLVSVLDLFPRLAERRNQQVRTLSGGERQMVAIGLGLMGDPKLLMLDEPTLGLAPRVREVLEEAVERIAQSGVALLIVDQDVNLLFRVCRRQYLIEQGSVSLELQPGESIDKDRILEMYFGTGGEVSDGQ